MCWLASKSHIDFIPAKVTWVEDLEEKKTRTPKQTMYENQETFQKNTKQQHPRLPSKHPELNQDPAPPQKKTQKNKKTPQQKRLRYFRSLLHRPAAIGRAGATAGSIEVISRRFSDGAPESGLDFFVHLESPGGGR